MTQLPFNRARSEFEAILQHAYSANRDPEMTDFHVTGVDWTPVTGAQIRFVGLPAGRAFPEQTTTWWPDRPTLIGALARTVAIRSLRANQQTGAVPAMCKDWRNTVSDYFGQMFRCHIGAGSGWADLIIATCSALAEVDDGTFTGFTQIKEKFGALCLYHGGRVSDRAREIIYVAEILSASICEDCGSPGHRRRNSWIRTLCDEHAATRPEG